MIVVSVLALAYINATTYAFEDLSATFTGKVSLTTTPKQFSLCKLLHLCSIWKLIQEHKEVVCFICPLVGIILYLFLRIKSRDSERDN